MAELRHGVCLEKFHASHHSLIGSLAYRIFCDWTYRLRRAYGG